LQGVNNKLIIIKVNDMKVLINNNLKKFILLLSLSTLMLFLGCSKSSDYSTNPSNGGTPGTNEVLMKGKTFSPAVRTVNVGTTVKWTNNDNVAHTITSGTPGSPSGLFDSGNLNSNGVFTFTFNQAGTYKYYCKIHTMMTGTVIVQ
jgi:plastocyanin